MFNRPLVQNQGGLPLESRAGFGNMGNNGSPVLIATDAALALTVAQISSGAVQLTSFSAGRVVTTPTAAAILAAAPEMDIGDSFQVWVSCKAAFAATWAAGAGVTLAGRATTPASDLSLIIVTKLSATTVEWFVM